MMIALSSTATDRIPASASADDCQNPTPHPFFVVGVGRSGTTLLRLMLNSHPRLAIPYEGHFIPRYIAESSRFGALTEKANRRRLLEEILNEPMVRKWDHVWDADDLLERSEHNPTLSGIVAALYEQYADAKGKPRWGDKSEYIDGIPGISRLFPTAKFIHIVRDGRDVANSVLRLPWGPNDLIAAATWWNDYVWVCRRMGQILGPDRYMEVRFEDLLSDPEAILSEVCLFLGEDFSREMLEYHRRQKSEIPDDRKWQHQNSNVPPTTARAFAWKQEMKPVDVAIFQRYGGRMLAELGYDPPETPCSKLRMGFRYAGIVAHKLLASRSG
ncbi:MAG: sulfotransferase [Planctomycetaceae bacterium]